MPAHGGGVLDLYSTIYADISTELTRVLPPGWQRAFVQAEMEIDNGAIAAFAIAGDIPKPIHVKMPVRVFECFSHMQRIARDNDTQRVWTTATFILRSDGSFDIDYGYDPIPIEEQFNRRIAWKKRYALT